MIEIHIKTGIINGEDKILDTFNCKDATLDEVSVVFFRLQQIAQDLLNKQFEDDFYMEKDE
jgi:hypothetical protein